uniref:Uncharacterized protein n=1 Tax=Macaca mulatta TaxID=9544 RepID=A0A5F8AM52_MACMU
KKKKKNFGRRGSGLLQGSAKCICVLSGSFYTPSRQGCSRDLSGALGKQDRGEGTPCSRLRLGPRAHPHLLDMSRNVLLYVVFLQRLSSALHRVLLHLFRHVRIFDHGLSVAHGYLVGKAWGKGLSWAAPPRH